MNKTYVVIGSSAAGIAALATLKRLNPQAHVVCITKSMCVPYNTCFLASYVAQEKTVQDISLTFPDVSWYRGVTVVEIDRKKRCVLLNTGESIYYDMLLLSVGTEPLEQDCLKYIQKYKNSATQKISSKSIQGIASFYTLEDAIGIKEFIAEYQVTDALIVGAGLTGLECADALTKLAIDVTIIEQNSTLLPAFLDAESGVWLAKQLALTSSRITLITDDTIKEINHERGSLVSVDTVRGRKIKAQLMVFAIGGRPAVGFAKKAELANDMGIPVDAYFKTIDPAIYAAGDCALVKHKITGHQTRSCTWPDAVIQAIVAAYNMTGIRKEYAGILPMYTSVIFGIPVAVLGGITYNTESNISRSVYKGVLAGRQYYYLFFIDHNKRVKGCVLLGCTEQVNKVKKIIETQESFELFKTKLETQF